jgi:ribosomal protein S18 acetylase RimI-like enzyme
MPHNNGFQRAGCALRRTTPIVSGRSIVNLNRMNDTTRFIPASTLSLEEFAHLYTRSFENYFYPITLTAAGCATRARTEQLDLHRSVVLMLNEAPVGQATLALRGESAWCGGFGIVPECRGRHLASPLFSELIAQARDAGAKTLVLEVLTQNTAAQEVYFNAGLRRVRETRLLKWKREPSQTEQATPGATGTKPADMCEIVSCFYRLHPVSPVWTRDIHYLICRSGLLQLDHIEDGNLQGYVLLSAQDGIARIYDLGARDVNIATALLTSLQAQYRELHSVNEPGDSPLTAAYDQCNFRDYDRQYEFKMVL